MTVTWYVERARTGEQVVPGKRLGRNVSHDSRNRRYPHRRSGRALTSQLWPRNIPILDQGNTGSCTGEEETGALGTGPLWAALSPDQRALVGQALAYRLYSDAEVIDGDGPYPPYDNGSSGPSAAQAALNMGFIAGYTHCFAVADVLDALETGPVGIGSNWYSSMDSPDSTGLVTVSPDAYVRGGHEYLCRGKDVDLQLLHFDNSWGPSFGVNGSFSYSYATLERLLSEQGDATVSLPLTVPAPQPVPPPPAPVPVPVPDADPADVALAQAVTGWASRRHAGEAGNAAAALRTWLHAEGFL